MAARSPGRYGPVFEGKVHGRAHGDSRRTAGRPHADLDTAEPDDDRAASHDLSLDVQSFIATRPESLRTILALLLTGYDRKEIGIATGLSQAAICRLLAPVRVELRRWLDSDGRGDEPGNVV